MANFNKVLLIGNLTRDPELRYTPGGTAVADFGMAVNRNWTSQGGEKREETLFVDLEAWARTAEVISEYCKKGSPLFVEGRLKLDQWEGRDGQKRSKLRVVVERSQFLSGGRRSDGGPRGEGGPRRGGRQEAPPQQGKGDEEEAPRPSAGDAEGQYQVNDDIPF